MSLARDNIARMSGYVPGEQPQDRRYVKLNTNENPYPPSPEVTAALRSFDTERLRLYPQPVALELRDEAAAQAGLTADWVLCGNGSDDLLTIAVRTFVDPGGAIAYPTPTYSLYPVLAGLQDARVIEVALTDSFELPDNLANRMRGAALAFIARPNAPTGNAFRLDALHQLCAEFAGVVWIDEAYADFAQDHCLDFVQRYPNVVVSRSFSKSFSLAGIRLGLAYAAPELIDEMLKVKDSYNVNMLTQQLGLAALRDRAWMAANADKIRATRTRVSDRLREIGCTVLPSAANFIFAKPPKPARQVFAELRGKGYLVRYFDQPRIDDYIRITIGTDQDMNGFIAAMDQILA